MLTARSGAPQCPGAPREPSETRLVLYEVGLAGCFRDQPTRPARCLNAETKFDFVGPSLLDFLQDRHRGLHGRGYRLTDTPENLVSPASRLEAFRGLNLEAYGR